MIISASNLDIADFDRVLFSIPRNVRKNYKVVESNNCEYFVIRFRKESVAVVTVLEIKSLNYSFVDRPSGNHLEDIMERHYGTSEVKNELLWLVLFPMPPLYWSFIGRPEKTKEAALKWVNENTMDRLAILVSFYT
jgi:hypothetical protein